MPILNHRDYRTARAQIAQLMRALSRDGVIADISAHLPADVAAARQQALRAELERLETDVAAYEKLRGSPEQRDTEPTLDVDDLGLLPIIGRITRRLSQRELAELLNMKEQQVQRYERERYAGISLARYQRTLEVLGIELQPRLLPLDESETRAIVEPEPNEIPTDVLREIRKRGWVELPPDSGRDDQARCIALYIGEGASLAKGVPYHRKSVSAKPDDAEKALAAWRVRVLRVAAERRSQVRARFNIADPSWVKDLIALSIYPDGPLRAAEMLRAKGILLVVEPQLPHTLLDGAALLLLDGGVPVVGLTLRHDRLDNFWYTLLHELGHVFLHFNHGLEAGFLDDDLDGPSTDQVETEADSFARSQLLPDEVWNVSPARFARSPTLISSFAQSRNIHPAIVAGRIRRDRNDYRIFGDLIGRGQVRRLFLSGEAN
ncbi:MAG: XRE family transcriptional regulator [Alphaproteobacteria bacterium]